MEMDHPAELPIRLFLMNAVEGKAHMSEEIIERVADDIKAALNKQFNGGPRDTFKLRMSNLGRPKCQLWYEKNKPELKADLPPNFMMNMMIGDIVEAVFKGVLRAAGVPFKDAGKVKLELPDGTIINGEYDMILDGRVDDVKSASDYSYNFKFKDLETLQQGDSFGYCSQLVGYAKAADKDVGGWWVVNKMNGHFKYVDANGIDDKAQMDKIQETVEFINQDKPFERCFEPEPETFYKKETGNLKLCATCGFCGFKRDCWPELQSLPSRVSKAKSAPIVDYVFIGDGLD